MVTAGSHRRRGAAPRVLVATGFGACFEIDEVVFGDWYPFRRDLLDLARLSFLGAAVPS